MNGNFLTDIIVQTLTQYKVKGVKNYVGKKGCRTDFYIENSQYAFIIRWIRSKPIPMDAEKCSSFINRWMEDGTIWNKAKKLPNAWHVLTENGMVFRRLVKIKKGAKKIE
jgi:hypothetical protein